ncbi:MAG: PHP domain-containing protein [Peptostreptococcaceae bacterium]
MLILIYNGATVTLNQDKKMVQVKVKRPDMITEELTKKIEEIKKRYSKYSLELLVDEKYKVDNLMVNEIYKLSKHLNQKITLMVYVVEYEEKKLRSGKFMYTITMEIPGKKKFVKGKLFSDSVYTLESKNFYHITGKVVEEDPRYIKKNEASLGKNKDYAILLSTLEKHVHEKKIKKDLYDVPRQELHAHSMFSKRDGFITEDDISKAFIENKIDQIAITDHGAAFAFMPFVNGLKNNFKDSGKRLLLGCEFYSVDTDEYDLKTSNEILELESNLEILSNDTSLDEALIHYEGLLVSHREQRDISKKMMARKTISEDEREKAKAEYEFNVTEINSITEDIKNTKQAIKDKASELSNKEISLTQLKERLGKTHEISRDHLTVIIKSQDSEMDYRGTPLKYNPGVLELYKLISKSYTQYFSTPTTKEMKMYGKRPTIPYHELFKEGVREHFIINSACAFGKHMKLAVEGKWLEFREWIKNLDAVELQPIHNNIYMVNHKDYKLINSESDLKKLHRKIYDICKEEGIKVIFTSDAHINDKEDRDIRSVFKSGYISGIKNQVAEGIAKRKAKGEIVEEEQQADEDDFSIETQPYILSYREAIEDLNKQGFSDEEAFEIMNNTKEIADQCANGFEITLAPKKMFLGDFPGVDVKAEVPRLTWEAAIKKYSTGGSKDEIEPKIKERIEVELDAIKTTGYEILYYISYWSCRKSEEMGYVVGSRGSAGSMMTTFLLGIGENNPLEPHYFCPKCKKVEWVETDVVGLDLPTKICECGTEMENDGCAIESHNFLGWGLSKAADIDLNFSSVVQTEVHKAMIDVFGSENMIKSGTQAFYQGNALKSKIFKHIPKISEKIQDEAFDIDYYTNKINTMDTTGCHPGGLLLKPNDIPFELITPLVYISDDPKKAEVSSFVDYHSLEDYLPKIDALGHSDPTMLKELQDFTGIDYKKIKFNDPKMYEAILDPTAIGIKPEDYPFPSTTMAISEMNSDFTMGVLAEIKPKNITDMIYFSGLTHGTAVYQGNLQRELILGGKPLHEVIPVRDIIFQQLVKKYNFDPAEAFTISESVRKGKGIKKWEKELREKCPHWYVEIMAQIKYLFPKA